MKKKILASLLSVTMLTGIIAPFADEAPWLAYTRGSEIAIANGGNIYFEDFVDTSFEENVSVPAESEMVAADVRNAFSPEPPASVTVAQAETDPVEYPPLPTSGTLSAGNYQLTGNTTLEGKLSIASNADVTIDLCGYVLQGTGTAGSYVIDVGSGTLTIIDTNPNTEHRGTLDDATGVWTLDEANGTTVITGGIICNQGTGKGFNVSGTLTMEAGTIAGCTGPFGSAVTCTSSGTLIMNGGQIIYNTTTDVPDQKCGSAIYGEPAHNGNRGSLIQLTSATVSNNTSPTTRGLGGAIYGYKVELENCTIVNNSAANGGAVYIWHDTNNDGEKSSLSVRGGRIADNEASQDGGAFYGVKDSTIQVSEGAVLDHNIATNCGGGIYGYKVSTNCTIQYNEAIDGAGIYIFHSTGGTVENALTVTGGIIAHNKASQNGGGVNGGESGITIAISDTIIEHNTADNIGGGIYGHTITLNNCLIQYNTVTKLHGGGVYVRGTGILTITGGTVSNNQAKGTDSYGGGLCGVNTSKIKILGNVTIEGNSAISGGGVYGVNVEITPDTTNICTIQNNKATTGAGIYATTSLDIDGGIITGNEATGNGGGVGGNSGCDISIDGTEISGNKAATGGGVFGYHITLNNTTISGNNATTNGGGVYSVTTIEFTNTNETTCKIQNNTAVDGAGIYLASTGSLTLANATITGNIASGNGGGIYSLATLTLQVCTIQSNQAANGAGIYATKALTLTSGIVASNKATANGGGIYATTTVEITDATPVCTISDNEAVDGAGIYFASTGTLTLANATITGNIASGNGGGIYSLATLTLNTCTISNNQAANGAGVYIGENASLTILGGEINTNDASNNGGGLFGATGSTIRVSGGTVVDGNSALHGGGIYGVTVIIDNLAGFGEEVSWANTEESTSSPNFTIQNNEATDGAGIYATTSLTVKGGLIQSNTATGLGGGIYGSSGCEIQISDGTIIQDNSANYGGGIYGWEISLTNCTVGNADHHNTATTDGGGIFIGSDGTLNASGTVSVTYNDASRDGGGIFGSGNSTITLSGTTIDHNTAGSDNYNGGGIYGFTVILNNCTLSYNTASNGAGAYATKSMTVNGGDLHHNIATGKGGALCITSHASLRLYGNADVYENQAEFGGGIYGYHLTLEYSTIRSNNAENGAGVFIDYNQNVSGDYILSITGVTIANNTATNNGAGIYAAAHSLVEISVGTSGTTIESNKATGYGGGIYAYNVTINSNATSPCSININEAKDGAGIYIVSSGTLTISGGSITGNIASGNGGGICGASGSNLQLLGGVLVQQNSATANGGGIYGYAITISNTGSACKIDDNTANQGAGVYAAGLVTVSGGIITNNDATSTGGGFFGTNQSRIQFLAGTSVKNNTATAGGGLCGTTGSKFEISGGSVIEANRSTTGVQQGGGIYGYNIDLTSSTVTGNTANQGAGIFVLPGGTLTIDNGRITNNTAAQYGGGIYSSHKNTTNGTPGGTVNLLGGTVVEGNTAQQYHGGGLFGGAGSTITLSGGVIVQNNTAQHSGGGIYAATLKINGTANQAEQVCNNKSYYRGGGIYVSESCTIDYGLIDSNYTTAEGGGIYTSCTTTITNSNITNNLAMKTEIYADGKYTVNQGRGGGMYIIGKGQGVTENITITLEKTNLSDNACMHYGGAAQVMNGATLELVSGSINNNEAVLRGAGAIHVTAGAIFTLTGGEISGNTARSTGGAIHSSYSCTLNLNGGTIKDNKVYGRGGGVHVNVGGNLILNGTTITGNRAETGYTYLASTVNVEELSWTSPTHDGIAISAYGGGVVVDAGTCTMVKGKLTNNFAEAGGGGIALVMINTATTATEFDQNRVASFEFQGGEISGNQTNGNGGGIYLMKNMLSSAILGEGNQHLEGTPHFTASGGTISGNTASGNGGAAYLDEDTEFNISGDAIFTGNRATGDGGAVYIAKGNANVSGGTISQNIANGNGGGVYLNGGDFTMIDGTLEQNIAENGGAVAVLNGNFIMQNGYLQNNGQLTATETCSIITQNGGAVYVSGGNVTIGVENCNTETPCDAHAAVNRHPIVEDNAAIYGGGFMVTKVGDTGGTLTLYCCLIISNHADNDATGRNIYVDGGDFNHNVKGAIVGEDVESGGVTIKDPGIVITGGDLTLQGTVETAESVTIVYHSNYDDQIKWETHVVDSYVLNLPLCPEAWREAQVNFTFVGWTSEQIANSSALIRDPSDYRFIGDLFEVKAEKAENDIIVFYAVWAPKTNQITYQYTISENGTPADADSTVDYQGAPSEYLFETTNGQIVLPDPSKAGCTFIGWRFYANNNTASNWGKDPQNGFTTIQPADIYAFGTRDATSGITAQNTLQNFGDLVLVAIFTENQCTIQYTIIPSGTGTLTVTTETVSAVTGVAEGSTANVNDGYKIIGWYLDEQCTQPVPYEWLTNNTDIGYISQSLIKPVKGEDAIWDDLTVYYVKLDVALLFVDTICQGKLYDGFTDDSTTVSVLKDHAFTIQYAFKVPYSNVSFITDRALPVGTKLILLDNKSWTVFLYEVTADTTEEISIDQFHAMSGGSSKPAQDATSFVLCVDLPSEATAGSYVFQLKENNSSYTTGGVTATLLNLGSVALSDTQTTDTGISTNVAVHSAVGGQHSLVLQLMQEVGNTYVEVDFPAGAVVTVGGNAAKIHDSRAIANGVENGQTYAVSISNLPAGNYKLKGSLAEQTAANHPMQEMQNAAGVTTDALTVADRSIAIRAELSNGSRLLSAAGGDLTFTVNAMNTDTVKWVLQIKNTDGTYTDTDTTGEATLTNGEATVTVTAPSNDSGTAKTYRILFYCGNASMDATAAFPYNIIVQ